jgi:hypothetical protein
MIAEKIARIIAVGSLIGFFFLSVFLMKFWGGDVAWPFVWLMVALFIPSALYSWKCYRN